MLFRKDRVGSMALPFVFLKATYQLINLQKYYGIF